LVLRRHGRFCDDFFLLIVRLEMPVYYYYNALFAGFPASQLVRLQSVLKAAAHLVLGLPGCTSVTAFMHNTLHWLSYPQRVTYKLSLLTLSVCKDERWLTLTNQSVNQSIRIP